ncbi:MAG: hypothetical protein M3N30_03420, partial [Bacteroidota bacterium]|nr:hypothetical protein [Bacteroidota bacterium]
MRDSKKTSFDQIHKGGTDKEILDNLLKETFAYFLKHTDQVTGLVADKSQPGSPCSIAVAGMGLTAYIAGIENRLIPKHDAILNILKMLRFFYYSPQGKETDATGYKGFYYHFLDMKTGRRVWNSEISTIDTALFMAGVMSVVSYFSADIPEENEIRQLGNYLYLRVDWQWALNKRTTITHGWTPESGFIRYRWDKFYNEAIIL